MSTSEAPPRASLSHFGYYVRDLDAQADFYKRVLALSRQIAQPHAHADLP